MHRFRKRSDAKRSHLTASSGSGPASPIIVEPDSLPEIQLDNDFRSSLILPDLSRRFSLLRTQTGEPIPIHNLKTRLANQRARGSQNQISEEEESMILETLGQLHSEDHQRDPSSAHTNSSPTGSPSGKYSGKKNTLGGSARYHDFNSTRSVGSQQSTASVDVSESSPNFIEEPSQQQRARTPDSTSSNSAPSTPGDGTVRRGVSPIEPPMSVAEWRLSKVLGPSALKRASLAVQEAIRELEEEAEDEIVMPRIPPPQRSRSSDHGQSSPDTSQQPSSYDEPGMAISSDNAYNSEDASASPRASPVPSKAKPGYIPGMPRPVTPHGLDSDELRSLSTTPRAAGMTPLSLSAPRRGDFSDLTQSPTSPTSNYSRPSTDHYSSDDFRSRDIFAADFDVSLTSSILGRRRPNSPLAGTPYQAMNPSPSSRPGTPSNITWRAHSPKPSGHVRNGSIADDVLGNNEAIHSTLGRSRSLRSPALPDSPTIDGGQSTILSSMYPPSNSEKIDLRSFSPMPSIDIGSPAMGSSRLRSPTPTQAEHRPIRSISPPTSSQFTEMSSRTNPYHKSNPSAFSFGSLTPFSFNPLDNSSRSSLGSDGSSYHSQDHGTGDSAFSLFVDSENPAVSWHDLSNVEQTTANTSAHSDYTYDAAEDTIKRCAGLTKGDFFAIQEKLVSIAVARESTPGRERVPSLRRARRPSTSQSNYSINGIPDNKLSPNIPRTMSPSPSPAHVGTTEQDTRTRVLLDSMAPNYRQYSPSPAPISVKTSGNGFGVSPSSLTDPSPTSRRNRDLAKALFGQDDASDEALVGSKSAQGNDTLMSSTSYTVPATPQLSASDSSSPSAPVIPPGTYFLHRNASTHKIPQSAGEQEALAREVQRKADAATDALRKNPSTTKVHEIPVVGGTAIKKKITPKHISNPQFVSSSTSLETVPLLQSAAAKPGSKMSQRIKKLRGTLRTKPNTLPNGEEVTPFPVNLQPGRAISPENPAGQSVQYHQSSSHLDIPHSAVIPERMKHQVPSPPASAGPGLKGFIMSRFRGRQRGSEGPNNSQADSLNVSQYSDRIIPHSAHAPRRAETPASAPGPVSSLHEQTASSGSASPVPTGEDAQVLQQLFEAASHFGLDQEAVNDLLARKASTASRGATLTRSNTALSMKQPRSRPQSPQTPREGTTSPAGVIRALSLKKRNEPVNRSARDAAATSTVVRRTIFIPSADNSRVSTLDFGSLMRRASKSRRRSSIQSDKSIPRSPTPPIPSATGKRFSRDAMTPPVPHLPGSSSGSGMLQVPQPGGPDKSSTAYESFYDMYGEESKSGIPSPTSEAGPAIELIELANGETIWSIVNGLRDDDNESYYGSRTSFASDYSARDTNGGLQVFVKEHNRTGSKGSTGSSSYLPKRRNSTRPETKVFYSSPAEIGRLIENISEGMNAGSFNFLPGNGTGHSNVSSLSDVHWTVEERLDHMLGSMSRQA
jgi:serine/arginine repetitive matrix protein 2